VVAAGAAAAAAAAVAAGGARVAALHLLEGCVCAVYRRVAAAGVVGGRQKSIRGELPLSVTRCSYCLATSGGEGAAAAAADAHPQEEATRPASLSAQRETLDDSRW